MNDEIACVQIGDLDIGQRDAVVVAEISIAQQAIPQSIKSQPIRAAELHKP